jgi:hypothetical protein
LRPAFSRLEKLRANREQARKNSHDIISEHLRQHLAKKETQS